MELILHHTFITADGRTDVAIAERAKLAALLRTHRGEWAIIRYWSTRRKAQQSAASINRNCSASFPAIDFEGDYRLVNDQWAVLVRYLGDGE